MAVKQSTKKQLQTETQTRQDGAFDSEKYCIVTQPGKSHYINWKWQVTWQNYSGYSN